MFINYLNKIIFLKFNSFFLEIKLSKEALLWSVVKQMGLIYNWEFPNCQ